MYHDDDPDYDDHEPRDPWRDAVLRELRAVKSMTALGTLALLAALLLLVLLLLAVSARPVHGAPAPLPKRQRVSVSLPGRCLMTWRGHVFDHEFLPDGTHRTSYRGAAAATYRGTWRLERRVLYLRECYVNDEGVESGQTAYEIHLDASLRRGIIDPDGTSQEVNFVLEAKP